LLRLHALAERVAYERHEGPTLQKLTQVFHHARKHVLAVFCAASSPFATCSPEIGEELCCEGLDDASFKLRYRYEAEGVTVAAHDSR
jgi:hypothetical protein